MTTTICRTLKRNLLSQKPAISTNSLQLNQRQNEDGNEFVHHEIYKEYDAVEQWNASNMQNIFQIDRIHVVVCL